MRCPYGESCTHAHGIEELRLPHGEVLPEGMEAGYVGHTHGLDGHHGQLDYKLPQDQQSILTFSGEDAELSLPMLVNQFGVPPKKGGVSGLELPPPWDPPLRCSSRLPNLKPVTLEDPVEVTGPVFRL